MGASKSGERIKDPHIHFVRYNPKPLPFIGPRPSKALSIDSPLHSAHDVDTAVNYRDSAPVPYKRTSWLGRAPAWPTLEVSTDANLQRVQAYNKTLPSVVGAC